MGYGEAKWYRHFRGGSYSRHEAVSGTPRESLDTSSHLVKQSRVFSFRLREGSVAEDVRPVLLPHQRILPRVLGFVLPTYK